MDVPNSVTLAAAEADAAASLAERERAFYNEKGETSYHLVRGWIWRAIGEFRRNEEAHDLYDAAGKDVLDYGCGPGYLTKQLIDAGAASVTGIDVSNAEIEQAQRRARQDGVEGRCRFLVADAHATGFPDDSFDLVIGDSIIHHLDVRRALVELRRILRPDGTAVFLEPLWHNPLLRVGRALTPSARTPDEHPLTVDDWALCAEIFPAFDHEERELFTIPLMPLNLVLPTRLQRRLAKRVWRFDDRMLARFPGLRKHARSTFLVMK
ncbi:MAG: Methyltransferase type 11 [Solirubrobacterales bacterium]|nr:Methyltransferase type 11 [Solirubrobacterales bacterium]